MRLSTKSPRTPSGHMAISRGAKVAKPNQWLLNIVITIFGLMVFDISNSQPAASTPITRPLIQRVCPKAEQRSCMVATYDLKGERISEVEMPSEPEGGLVAVPRSHMLLEVKWQGRVLLLHRMDVVLQPPKPVPPCVGPMTVTRASRAFGCGS